MEQDSKRLEAMTFEEIRDKLAEQEFPLLADADMFQVERRTFCLALDMIRPLLDGWKEFPKHKPKLNNEEYFIAGLGMVTSMDWVNGKWKSDVFNTYIDQSGVTHWRELPTLPGDFSQLEALLTDKK